MILEKELLETVKLNQSHSMSHYIPQQIKLVTGTYSYIVNISFSNAGKLRFVIYNRYNLLTKILNYEQLKEFIFHSNLQEEFDESVNYLKEKIILKLEEQILKDL